MRKSGACWRVARLIAFGVVLETALIPATAGFTQPNEDPERVRELAERILATGSSGFGWGVDLVNSGPRPIARLLPGRLPDDLPLAVPAPPSAQIVGSVARTIGGELASAEILIDAPGTPAQLRPIYETAFSNQGWTTPAGFATGGFQQSSNVLPYMRCAGDEWGGMAMLTFGQLDAGRSEIRLYLYLPALARTTTTVAPFGFNPCSTAPGSGISVGTPSNRRDLLPALIAPAGSRLQTTGGAMGNDYATSEAIAESELTAGELEAYFSVQLERLGWEKLARGDAGAVAFGRWALPNEPDWFGLLAILETPSENRYALTVRVERTEAGSGNSGEWSERTRFIPVQNIVIPRTELMNPGLPPQQMAQCLANSPDPASCMAESPR